VTGEARPGLVELKIADNGRGIDPAQHDDVFALFKTSKSQGMGVGLWLSQSIVTSHRGQLSLQSAPGQGAVFSLTLPSHEYV
jgi:signal transduction histidine kinase